jgi:hypothetical protein
VYPDDLSIEYRKNYNMHVATKFSKKFGNFICVDATLEN